MDIGRFCRSERRATICAPRLVIAEQRPTMQIGAVGRLDHPSMVNTLSDRPSGGALADRQCRIADFVRREGQVRGCRSSPDLGIRYARRSAPSRPSRRAARSRRCRPLPWCGPGVALGGSRCPWSCAGPARWLRPLTGGRRIGHAAPASPGSWVLSALRAAWRADATGTLTASAALLGFAPAFGLAAALRASRGRARSARM